MAETINMTSLNDLPSNPANGGNIQMKIQQPQDNQGQSLSLDQATISQIVNGLQQASLSGATRLQSRDIPMTSEHLASDNQAMPNYVPKDVNKKKYIDEDDDDVNINYGQNNNLNNLYSELQFPLLLGILYFIFQMPVFKNTLFQYCSFLFSSDGNYNINGLTILSIMFSLTYYVCINVIFKKV
jgi:hypothetical protein